jgi:hypothetical protein
VVQNAHNHPSGLAEPNHADEMLTQALKAGIAPDKYQGAGPFHRHQRLRPFTERGLI